MLISRAELKHTTDKVVVTLYVYNRQLKYYIKKLKRLVRLYFLKKSNLKSFYKLKIVRRQSLKIISKIIKQKQVFFNTLSLDKNVFSNYESKYVKIFVLKCLREEKMHLYLKQIIFFNKSKFEKTYLLPLNDLIKNIYNKKVDFNLVNLKYYYLNSHIFTKIIVTKIRNKKNKLLSVLKNSLSKFKLPHLDRLAIYNDIYNRK